MGRLSKAKDRIKDEIVRDVIETVAGPIIINLLASFSDADIAEAIATDRDLADLIWQNPSYANHLRSIAWKWPFFESALPYLKDKKWIEWGIRNKLAHERPGAYNQIIYTPKGMDYIVRQVQNIVEALFG